jgi:hypothetical protein
MRGALVPVLLLALLVAAIAALRPARLEARPLLPLAFAHADHQTVNCVGCHHEFVDATPRGPCLECHKTDRTVAARIEPLFHELCLGCHVERQRAGEDGGPVRRCAACHTADDRP